jgi:DNA-binding transcriptional MerR regulator
MSDSFPHSSNPMPISGGSIAPSPVPSRPPMEMKAPGAFRTISEVATDLEVPQHVLRFWESKFQQVRPLKRGGGRRYYRPEDVQLLNSIKDLLYNQGFTIRGVQKLLREGGRSPLARAVVGETHLPQTPGVMPLQTPSVMHQPAPRGLAGEKRREVESVLGELKALRELLRQSGI